MSKRLISLILVMAMVLPMVPVAAGAQTESPSVSNDLTLEAENSFGTLLSNTVSGAEGDDAQEQYNARICDLVVEGTIATVEYTTPVEANLVVAIYTEDGSKLLGSGTAAVSPEETVATVEIEIASMPYYFKAGAYLLDARNNDPVSGEFKTDRYTKTMQDILAATVDDFNPELVLNLDNDRTTNFAVFNEHTLLAEAGGEQNQITDNGNGTYTVANADERFLFMKPGDSFAYTYPDGTVLIVNAASVSVSGTTVTVSENADADLSNVFDFVKIEEDSCDKTVTYDDSTLSEGLTVISDEEFAADQEEPQAATFGLRVEVDEKGSIGTNFGISHRIKGDDNADITISGKIAFGLTLNLKVYLSLNYQYVSFSCDYSLSGSVALTGKLKLCELPMGKFDIALCAGVFAHVDPSFVVEASGSISYKIEWKGSVGQAYDSDLGRWSDISAPPSVKSKVEFSGKLFIGVKAKLGISVISRKTLDLSVSGTVGFEVSASDKWQGVSSPSSSEVHTCAVCFEGEVDKVASLALEIKIFGDFWKDKWTLAELKSKMSDIYFSADNMDWGFTKCPYKAYKTTVTVLSQSREPVQDVVVNLFEDGSMVADVLLLDENGKPVTGSVPTTDENGKSVFYLPNGAYSILAVSNG
ncbi:MAG: hypothetical protein MR828_14040, partial [Clostridiales bacterium]|nr:hypothetical protein [Clostridiales bacterium]